MSPQIHFDGWSHVYDFWIDADHPDIHPIGWCSKTGHPLQPPLSKSCAWVSPSYRGPDPHCHRHLPMLRNGRAGAGRVWAGRKGFSMESSVGKVLPVWRRQGAQSPGSAWGCSRDNLSPVSPPGLGPKEPASSAHGGCPTLGCKSIPHTKSSKYSFHHR